MLPIPIQTRQMPKLDLMDLIEQGFGQNMSLYSQVTPQVTMCQFHKYKLTNEEYMLFKEDYSAYMFAKKYKKIWLIYTRDPSDSQFEPQNFQYTLKIENMSLWKGDILIAAFQIIKADSQISYNRIKILIINGQLKNVPLLISSDLIPNGCTYCSTIPPIYNSRTKSWYMEDCERIEMHSKRNFLVGINKEKIFKMGKIQKGAYIVDYSAPLNLEIVMGIALSTCEWKSKLN